MKADMVPVRVGAVFERGRIRPVWFVTGSEKRDIQKVTYRWKERVGQTTLLHFTVDIGGDIYELICRSDTLEWFLVE